MAEVTNEGKRKAIIETLYDLLQTANAREINRNSKYNVTDFVSALIDQVKDELRREDKSQPAAVPTVAQANRYTCIHPQECIAKAVCVDVTGACIHSNIILIPAKPTAVPEAQPTQPKVLRFSAAFTANGRTLLWIAADDATRKLLANLGIQLPLNTKESRAIVPMLRLAALNGWKVEFLASQGDASTTNNEE